jgi:hypothetical protein
MLAILLLALTLAASTDSLACDRASLSHAETTINEAQRVQFACMDPGECTLADQLVRAAVEQLRAARALCDVPAPAISSGADPFEADAVATLDPDKAAWQLVCGDATAEECAGLDAPRTEIRREKW